MNEKYNEFINDFKQDNLLNGKEVIHEEGGNRYYEDGSVINIETGLNVIFDNVSNRMIENKKFKEINSTQAKEKVIGMI